MNNYRSAVLRVVFALLIAPVSFSAQQNSSLKIQGYFHTVDGFSLRYHGPLPGEHNALVCRSMIPVNSIAWETAAVPEKVDSDSVSFLWMFAIDVNTDCHVFDLYFNDKYILSLHNPVELSKQRWTVKGKGDSRLQLRSTLIDRYGDFMGYAVLTVPVSLIKPGQVQHVRIQGESSGSRSWFITFEEPINEGLTIQPENLLAGSRGNPSQVIRFQFMHIGNPVQGSVSVQGGTEKQFILEPGFNGIDLEIAAVNKPEHKQFRVKLEGKPEQLRKIKISPVKPWTVYLVQHTHTDIGYTRPQTEILGEHLRFIDYALDYCDQTDEYPEDSRFRWTCENSWAVKEYLKQRPQKQIQRFQKRVQERRIEVTAMLFNYSEVVDEAGLAEQCWPLRLFQEYNLPVKTAMQNDVNGIGWCLPDYLSPLGVEFVSMGQHGHRALIPFDKPTAFWWESPSGNRLLAFRADHYMTGNKLRLTTGRITSFRDPLLQYLRELEQKEYTYNKVSIQFSGYVTDNSPPSTVACDLVREWNRQYIFPRLRLATAGEFLSAVKKEHGNELEVYRAAWPDWWADGFGSAALETAAARNTANSLIAHNGLLTMARLAGSEIPETAFQEIDHIRESLLFWDEHTFGAAESIRDPESLNSQVQWREKSAYVWEAVKHNSLLKEQAMGLLQSYLPVDEVPVLVVINTLNIPRSGVAVHYIDNEIIPPGSRFRLLDSQGGEAEVQPVRSREDGTYWAVWAENVPPIGYKSYRIQREEGSGAESEFHPFSGIVENDFYRIEMDISTGTVISLLDKELNREFVDQKGTWGWGQFIYERLSNREQLENFRLDSSWYRTLQSIQMQGVKQGPIYTRIIWNGQLPQCADKKGITGEIRLYHTVKQIDVLFSMRKKPVIDPEAVYIAFPFNLPGNTLKYEVQGGMVCPGIDQLEGTASDWQTVQHYISVSVTDAQIVWASPDIPLVQLSDLNIGNFRYRYTPEHPHIYSWVLNNYWTTNFKASQKGALEWQYSLTSSSDTSSDFAARFGWSAGIPLQSRVLPEGEKRNIPLTRSFLEYIPQNLLLIEAEPVRSGGSIVLHFRECAGLHTELFPQYWMKKGEITSVYAVNVLNQPITGEQASITVKPYGTVRILLDIP